MSTHHGAGAPRSCKRLPFGIPRKDRVLGRIQHQRPYIPPEEWFEPEEELDGYQVIQRPAGLNYVHVVTPDDVIARLDELPEPFLEPLHVVCLSGMTRKKSRYPLYGMQWGTTIYLYPMLDSFEEFFTRPPNPAQRVEAKMYGARWSEPEPGLWCLSWSESQLRDFYLNNVLIHELGHLLDDRNVGIADRERYAEWFAIKYGYRPSRKAQTRRAGGRKIRRRHHSV